MRILFADGLSGSPVERLRAGGEADAARALPDMIQVSAIDA